MAKQPRHKSSTHKMREELKRETLAVESGLMEWTLTHLTSKLIDEAFVLELLGQQEDREKMALALQGTNFARVVDQLWDTLRGQGEDRQAILLGIFKVGFSLGIRTVDLAVIRRGA
jgi:hypothetical protein